MEGNKGCTSEKRRLEEDRHGRRLLKWTKKQDKLTKVKEYVDRPSSSEEISFVG